ncbi:MAG: DUF2778 domain-containing protein [Xanthobacteraceae bacterium]|nr:DUF2778 domain-containing protein [Xanthobacteraceae bacterium]
MTLAASPSSRAPKSRPRTSRSPVWQRTLAVSAIGLAVVVSGGVVSTAAMMGLGWLIAASSEARAGFHPVARATPPDRQAWAPSPRGEPARRSAGFDGLSIRQTTFRFSMPVRDPLGALALIVPEPSEAADDRIVTASIAPYVPRRVALEIITRGPDAAALAPQPLPRPRPKLASLGPVDGFKLRPDEDNALRPRTAIYDITAKTVYLPNGERLEAHSGFGEMMDDPRYRHVKMRGVTPPNTYNLTLRESLFHGVQAIRLNPVDEKAMLGRAGILAHSYLLGPNGQSNGCISFRDYPRFLRAFLRGEIDRIVVVVRLDKPPVFVDRAKVRGAATAL